MTEEGLSAALDELAEGTAELYGVQCDFVAPRPAAVYDNETATHLYYIAREAVSNAMRHGKVMLMVAGQLHAETYGFKPKARYDEVLNTNFAGIGFAVSEHLQTYSQEDIDNVYARVWRDMDPEHALVAHTWDWNEQTTVSFVKQVYGESALWLTTVDFNAQKVDLPEASKVVELLERLIKQEDVPVAKYILNPGWPGTARLSATDDDVAALQVQLQKAVDEKKLGVQICATVPGRVTVVNALGDDSVADSEKGMRLVEQTIDAINGGTPVVTIMALSDLIQRDYTISDAYSAAALLSKHIQGPSDVFGYEDRGVPQDWIKSDLKSVFLFHHDSTERTYILVNRLAESVVYNWFPLASSGSKYFTNFLTWRPYRYDPANAAAHPLGDVPMYGDDNVFHNKHVDTSFRVDANSVYFLRMTSDKEPPARIRSVDVSDADDGGKLIKWDPVADEDVCYYRVFRMNMPNIKFAKKVQIGSTIATQFVDRTVPAGKKWFYAVVATDSYDNFVK